MATAEITSAAVDSDKLYEVVNGEVVELPPMGSYEAWIASILHAQLHVFAVRELGRAVVELLFDFTKQLGNRRRPDVAFVSYERWPSDVEVPQTEAWDVVPNLAIEVVSPSNSARDVVDKVVEYLGVGVERVWVVYPVQRLVYIYSSPTDLKVIDEAGELADEAILPVFRLPLRVLFGPPATK